MVWEEEGGLEGYNKWVEASKAMKVVWEEEGGLEGYNKWV